MARQRIEDRGIIALLPDHILLEELQRLHRSHTGDDFDAWRVGHIVAADQRPFILPVERVADAQRDAGLAQATARAGMDRLHTQIGELIGHVIIGAADLARGGFPDQSGVGARQVKFLVNDRFARMGQHRNPREGHFRIAPRIAPHHAFAASGIARDDRHRMAQVDGRQRLHDPFVQAAQIILIPQRQIDERRVDPAIAQQQRGAVRAVRLAQPRQQFAYRQQLFLDAEAAMAAQPAEIRKAILHRRDPQIDKGIGLLQAGGAREHLAIAIVHRLAHLGHRLKPAVRPIIGDEAAIDARHAGFLMFQQQVGHARISGYDEDAVVEIVTATACDQDIVEQAGRGRH